MFCHCMADDMSNAPALNKYINKIDLSSFTSSTFPCPIPPPIPSPSSASSIPSPFVLPFLLHVIHHLVFFLILPPFLIFLLYCFPLLLAVTH